MWECYCCGKDLPDRFIQHIVVNEDGETVTIGSDCCEKVREAWTNGHYSEHSGVLLYTRRAYQELGQ